MKPIVLTTIAVALLAAAAAVFQHLQLGSLRAYANALRSGNASLAAAVPPPSSPNNTPSSPPSAPSDFDAGAILDRFAALEAAGPDADRGETIALLTELATASPASLRAIFDALPARAFPDHIHFGIAMGVLIQLVPHDPRFAAESSLTYIDQPGITEAVIAAFAAHDPDAAASWFDQAKSGHHLEQEHPDLVRAIDQAITSELANRSPHAALGRAAAATGQQRYDLLTNAARNLDTDTAWLAFARHAAAHDDPGFRATALDALSHATLNNSHFDDIRHVVDQVDQVDFPPDDLNALVRTAATRSIDDKTPQRATWLIARSGPDHLHQNIESLVSLWTSNDFNAAATWLGTLEPSSVRDTAVANFANEVATREPEPAAEWALTITDEPKKRATLDAILTTWQKSDPQAAAAYLEAKTSLHQ